MYELILQNGTSIQIAKNDFSDLCDWSSAKLKCEEIGEGWRLPTISELEERLLTCWTRVNHIPAE